MPNGSVTAGWRIWIVGIAGILVAAAVIGGIENAIGQGQLETQVEANRQTSEREIGHVIDDLRDMKEANKAAHKVLFDKMEGDKKEILEAIKDIK